MKGRREACVPHLATPGWLSHATTPAAHIHSPSPAPSCSLRTAILSLHFLPNSKTFCSHFVLKSRIRYRRSSLQYIFELLGSHVNGPDGKSPNLRRTVTAPVGKDEVQLATGVHSSSQGNTSMPYVSHGSDDVVQQQLICS